MTLGEYMAASMSKPWEWGVHDCTAWPARWAGVKVDYSTEEEAEARIAEAGSLEAIWDACEALEPVLEPAEGDVGIILAVSPDYREIEIGAIFTGKRWAFVPRQGGVAAASAVPVRVWRPKCHKR